MWRGESAEQEPWRVEEAFAGTLSGKGGMPPQASGFQLPIYTRSSQHKVRLIISFDIPLISPTVLKEAVVQDSNGGGLSLTS